MIEVKKLNKPLVENLALSPTQDKRPSVSHQTQKKIASMKKS